MPLDGTDPGQFDKGTDTCTGASVAPAATCTIQVHFSPTTTGAKTTSLRFTHNATGSPSDVALTGTGTTPATPPDNDGDGLPDGSDNCPNDFNPDQAGQRRRRHRRRLRHPRT